MEELQQNNWREARRVRVSVTIIVLVSATFIPIVHGQDPESDTQFSCVNTLELPTRGLLASGAGNSGVVHAVADIGKDGKVAHLQLNGGNPGLQAEVRVAMDLSKFATKCHGRALEFVFAFTLEDPPIDSLRPPAVRFVPPNRFELVFKRVKPDHYLVPHKNRTGSK
jgi:hypothetical protein